jgi:energy-coupling factor transporter transmembrane protein EcfT
MKTLTKLKFIAILIFFGLAKFYWKFSWQISLFMAGGVICAYFYVMSLLRKQETNETRYIPDKIKQEVLKIQDNKCAYCGLPFDSTLNIDYHHIKPFSQGGETTANNLSALHTDCHVRLTRSRKVVI